MKTQLQKRPAAKTLGQTSLDFLMTYGWAVLLVVVVVASLFALGVFNAGSFLGPRATGFAQIGVIAWNVNAAGDLALRLQNFAGMDINIINIEATYGISHFSYDITNVSIPNSKISDTFTVGTISGLAPGQYYTMPLRISYTDLNGFNYTETGTISGTVGAGAVPPSIRINSPHSNSLLANRTINISVSVWGGNLSYTDIMIIDETGTPVNVTTNSQLGTYAVELSVDADGVYNITALANYSDGGSASATASNITVNTTAILGCVQPPSGLVAWWPGDDNASDIIGGNDGTLMNGATFAPGEVGQAFSFDGIDDSIGTPINNLPLTDLTIDFWANEAPGNAGRIFGYEDIYSGADGLGMYFPSQTNPYLIMRDNGVAYDMSLGTITVGSWNHYAITISSTEGTKLYLNGIQTNSDPTAIAYSSAGISLRISSAGTDDVYFNGLIDEVQLYDRALSDSEIQAIYGAGTAGICKNASAQANLSVDITAPASDSVLDSRTITVNFTASGTNLNHTNVSILRRATDNHVWVANSDQGSTVSEIDKATRSVINTITVGTTPVGVAVDPDYVWVANEGSTVSKIEKSTGTVVANISTPTQAVGIAVDPTYIWTTDYGQSSAVTQIDKTSGTVIRTIPVGAAPVGIAVDNDYVWTANWQDGTVSRINRSDTNDVATIDLGPSRGYSVCYGIAIDQNYVWAANNGNPGSVWKIDKRTSSVTNIPLGSTPLGVYSDGRYVWTANSDGTVSKIDISNDSVVDTIPTGVYAENLAVDGDYIWVANSGDSIVTMINKSSDSVITTIGVGAGVRGYGDFTGYNYDMFFSAVNSTVVSTTSPGDYSVTIDVPSDGVYSITATAYDNAGNNATDTVANITVSTAAQMEGNSFVISEANTLALKFDSGGDNLWNVSFSGWATGMVSVDPVDNTTVIGAHGANQIKKVDNDGGLVWERNGANGLNFSNGPFGISVDPMDGSIIATPYSEGDRIVKLDSDGNFLWDRNIGPSCVLKTPVVDPHDGSFVMTCNENDYITKFDPDGDVIWSVSTGGGSAMYAIALDYSDSSVVAGTADHRVFKFDKDGHELWNVTLGDIVTGVSVDYHTGRIAAGTYDNAVTMLDGDGSTLWQHSFSAPAYMVLLAIDPADGSVVAGVPTWGRLIKYDSDGNLLWEKDAAGISQMNWISMYDNTFNASDYLLSCVQPPSGLISWWPGDGNASDIIGGNDGAWNGTTEAYASGKVSQAFSFDGNSAVYAPSPFPIPSAGTVSVWVYKTDESYYTDTIFDLDRDIPGGVRIMDDGSSGLGFYTNSQSELLAVTPAPSLNEWHHIVITWDGQTKRMYIDGVENTSAASTSLAQSSRNLAIGNLWEIGLSHLDWYAFNGLIDEVQVYDRALSASEVQAIYDAGSYGVCRPTAPPPIELSDCGNISYAGNYVLTDDVSNSDTCFTIEADNVTLDCAGHSITGEDSGDGIDNTNGNSYVTVRNCEVTGFSTGIDLMSNADNVIENNTVNSNYYGIYLGDSSNNIIANNTASSNGQDGISLYSSPYNIVVNNTVHDNQGNGYGGGIFLESDSDHNTIADNDFSSNADIGILLVASSDNVIANNTVDSTRNDYGDGDGILLYSGSDYNSITNNTANDNQDDGIHFISSSSNNITGNTVNSNGASGSGLMCGIHFVSSAGNIIANNTINSNGWQGIHFASSSGDNIIIGNNISSNVWVGFHFESGSNNIVANNTVDSGYSNYFSFYVESDSGGNTIANNTFSESGSNNGIVLQSSSNSLYNNLFNNTANSITLSGSSNSWNTALDCGAGPNIIGGDCIGGNYWANLSGTGWSETPSDCNANSSGICTSPYNIESSNVDNLPLTNLTPAAPPSEIPDYGFELGTAGSCPPNWTCTGDAMTASSSDGGYPCSIAGGIEGDKYGKAGCDNTIGTLTSDIFILPSGSDHLRFLRAGGANGPTSGVFVKRASDNAVLCSSTNGADTDTFFEDSCSGLSPYVGESVYIYVVDATSGGWGKTYVDGFHVQDSSNNNLLIS